MGDTKAFRCIIRGRVQGVGFRAFTEGHARELGLTGYVRNTPEGHVEVYAEGSEETLSQFLALLKKGPSLSHVREVDVQWVAPIPGHSRFEVRY